LSCPTTTGGSLAADDSRNLEHTHERFRESVAIVTGAGRGIGRAVALALAGEGASVVVNALHLDHCESVAQEIIVRGGRALAHVTDVADLSAVESMVAAAIACFGHIDILVNNAGILRPTSPLETISGEEWDRVMAVNVRGAFNCTRAVLPGMKRQRRGKIVNISSVAGRSTSNTGGAHYTASKAALLGFSRHCAREVAPYGINVNAIAPAGVVTDMVPEVASPERIASIVERIPVGRLAEPSEIAQLVVFLVSDEAAYITGATVDINGGLLII
jgi:3-oxoacyl-[acyl-carrier protein] reductase